MGEKRERRGRRRKAKKGRENEREGGRIKMVKKCAFQKNKICY